MKKIDALFMACVLGVAGTFLWMSWSHALHRPPDVVSTPPRAGNAAGEARDVDMDQIQQMLRQKTLSDREAEFYKPLDDETESP